jgi:hypothetical protein
MQWCSSTSSSCVPTEASMNTTALAEPAGLMMLFRRVLVWPFLIRSGPPDICAGDVTPTRMGLALETAHPAVEEPRADGVASCGSRPRLRMGQARSVGRGFLNLTLGCGCEEQSGHNGDF